MEPGQENTIETWRIAMIADGRNRATARDRCTFVFAVSRHVDKACENLTDLDIENYCETRGLKKSSADQVRAICRGYLRFLRTGVTNPHGSVRAAQISTYAQWLMDGKYTSTRRLGARRMAKRSAMAHAHHVAQIASFAHVHPTRLTTKHVEAWLADKAGTRETYRNRALRAVRYYSQFADIGDPTAEIMRFSEPQEEPRPRPADPECVAALLRHPDPIIRAMTNLGAAAGLRRAEISQVRGTDFSVRNGRWRLRVKGKGAKVRNIVLGARSIERMAPVFVPGVTRGRLFPELSADMDTGGDQVGTLLSQAAASLGHRMTAHQLRHYAATTMWNEYKDLEAVRRMMGHSNIATTMKYVEAWNDQIANDAADALESAIDRILEAA